MALEIKPQLLRGPWESGYALHVHTISSTYVGDDEWGHARFVTARSSVGELLYQLKYRRQREAARELAKAAAVFCQQRWRVKADAIVCVPPSLARRWQPVRAVAGVLGDLLGVPVCEGLSKVKRTPQLKDLTDYDERIEALRGVFEVRPQETRGKRLLLVDDIYGSGATLRTIAQVLRAEGGARAVHVLTLTKKA